MKFADIWKNLSGHTIKKSVSFGYAKESQILDLCRRGKTPQYIASFLRLNVDDVEDFISEATGYGKMDISAAGSVPNSLLARQDLEDRKRRMNKSRQLDPVIDDLVRRFVSSNDHSYQNAAKLITNTLFDDRGLKNALEAIGNHFDVANYVENYLNRKDPIKIRKSGAVDETTKELADIQDAAEEAETDKEKESLVARIKATQIERQQAVIDAREKSTGAPTFNDIWRNRVIQDKQKNER